jgi:hypothetical protein
MGKLMAVFDCENEWLTTSWKCFEGSHLGMVLGTAIIVVLFTVFSLIGTPAVCAIARVRSSLELIF